MRKHLLAILTAALAFALSSGLAAAPKQHFSVCWSIYAGWMPWEYGASRGIVDKWAKKYGIDIDVVQVHDYVESINQYTAGQFDGCSMTNMDALTIPAAGGVDSTALIVGDFSNGNDGIVIKGENLFLNDIKGQPVNLVKQSVSHYLLARGLQRVGLSERDVQLVNASDATLVADFAAPDVRAATTWNPLLAELVAKPGVTKVFDSRQIPGEIIDLMVVNSQTLADNPDFGKALTGAWYEIMATMSADGHEGKAARAHMAKASGTDLRGYEAQLETTRMFYSAREAADFARSPKLPVTMLKVAKFSFEQGLLGRQATDADAIGMSFANGDVTGDRSNVKLRFDASYMQLAADGKL